MSQSRRQFFRVAGLSAIAEAIRGSRITARLASLFLGSSLARPASASASDANPIVIENQQPGSDAWQLWRSPFRAADDRGQQIKGYASATSVNKGESVTFFVTVNPAQTFTIAIYRVGWYQGKGGRLLQQIGPLNGVSQAGPIIDATTGLIECNWVPVHTLLVPDTWTAGIYLALLTNAAGYQSYITFVVRDDARVAGLLYQQSVTTFQAYNNYPNDGGTGKSLYDSNSYGPSTVAGSRRAVKVSFDRPYSDYGDGNFLWWEVYFVRWLERSGVDVSYSTNVDTHTSGSRLLNYKGFLSVGHDEYWSKQMYDAVELARDSGVNLAFFGANEVYWQIRFEPSLTTGRNNGVVVCYKTWLDPVHDGSTTTLPWSDSYLHRPEQRLAGLQWGTWFNYRFLDPTANFPYVVTNSAHWIYDGTGFRDGDQVPGVVGYEVDRYIADYPLPNYINQSYTLLSHSPIVDYSGAADYANSSIYQAPSGAWVFAAGTIAWSWALDMAGVVDPRIQQTTANILNRLLGNGAPAPPGALTATGVSATQVDLSWTDNSTDEESFVLERSTTATFVSIASNTLAANTTSFADTGLSPNATYYYRVKAVKAGASSAYSNTASATTQAATVAAPSGLIATASSPSQINLTWTDNSPDESNFVLERSTTATFASVTSFTVAANVTSFANTGLSANTTYYYRVKAVRAGVSSSYSNTPSATTPATLPAKPTKLGASRGGTGTTQYIKLTWRDNANNETTFIIERSTNGVNFSQLVQLPANSTSYTNTGVAMGTTYYYRVKAANTAGSSAYSNVASATTL